MGVRNLWQRAAHTIRTWGPISLIVVADPVSSTLLLPFVYFMVRSFGYEDQDVGARAGWITSAFFLAQAPTIPLWCLLSDRLGRKPVLLLGLLGTSLSLVLFGLSQSLVWAILARTLGGLISGNGAVGRTLIVELAAREGVPTGKAFTSVGFFASAGWVAGPLMGGLFTSASDKPGETANFWRKHPFLLPCLAGALFNLMVLLICAVGLPETKVRDNVTRSENNVETGPEIGHEAEAEREPLLNGVRPAHVDDSATTASNNVSKSPDDSSSPPSLRYRLLLSAFAFSLHTICIDELSPLFLASPTLLAFSSSSIAKALSAAGPGMLLTLLLLPCLQRRFSSLALWRISAVVFAVLYPSFTLLPGLSDRMVWAGLVTLVVARYSAVVVGFTTLMVLVNETVSNSERALFNGLTQSVGSVARTAGPALAGTLWSWSNKNGLSWPMDWHFTFFCLGLVAVMQGISVGWWGSGAKGDRKGGLLS